MLSEHLNANQPLNQTALDTKQLSKLKEVVNSYSALQLAWASGYLAAKSETCSMTELPAANTRQPASKLTILFGSQTGNAKGVAHIVAEQAQAQGLTVDLKNMAEFFFFHHRRYPIRYPSKN